MLSAWLHQVSLGAIPGMSFINIFKSISNFQFPYSLEDKPVYESTLWQVLNGTRKSDSSPVTVFKANRSQQNEDLILNAIHKAKVLRIPGLCPVLETFDSDPQSTFIITERVKPFPWDDIRELQSNGESIQLGISQLLTTLKFLNEFVVGTISRESIFIDSKGQWLLFGMELCQKKSEISSRKFASDVQLYNKLMGLQTTTDDFQRIDSLQLSNLIIELIGSASKVPTDWQVPLQNLSRTRITFDAFMSRLESTNTWLSNPLISISQQLKELHIKDPQDKLAVMLQIQSIFFDARNVFHNMTPGFIEGLLLPELSNIIQWLISTQNSSASSIARLIPFLAIFLDLTIDKDFFPEASKTLIYECFALPDRQVRFLLLIYLPKVAKKLSSTELSGKIFPRFAQGLADSDPTLRLQTLKNIPIIVPHITERQLNNELLRHLAKTQVDQDVDIRTWTVIIITQIATLLSTSSGNRASILATAFTKSLKDPIIKPRLAALYGLKKTIDLFDVTTIANKILTVIAPGLLDKDPLVRSKAKNLFEKYLNKLESEAKCIQESSKSVTQSEDINFDEYGKNEEKNDAELVKQFMSTVVISSFPDQSPSPNVTTVEPAPLDAWDTFDDDKNNEGNSDSTGVPFSTRSTPNSHGHTSYPSKVTVEESWNDDFDNDGFGNDDSTDAAWADGGIWEAEQESKPVPSIGKPVKPVKKVSILANTKTRTSILTPRSKSSQASAKSRASIKDRLKVNKSMEEEPVGDDGWDNTW